jgi:hypothetical protein
MKKQKKAILVLAMAMITSFIVVGLLLPVLSSAGENARFTDLGNGTVRDNETGLIWLKNANCFRWKGFDKAMELAGDLASGQCGLEDGSIAGDWRLPSVWEWEDLFVKKYRNPALCNTEGTGKWKPGDAFDNVQNLYYWTGSSFPDPTGRLDNAYCVYLYYGVVHSKERALGLYVWPVRDPF